jgi:hypothetical protein
MRSNSCSLSYYLVYSLGVAIFNFMNHGDFCHHATFSQMKKKLRLHQQREYSDFLNVINCT